jgi:uncharacterized protein DUF4333
MRTISSIRRGVAATAAVVGLVVGSAACAAAAGEHSDGTMRVPGEQIEQDINELAQREEGRPADSIECPDLPAVVNSSIRCTLVTSSRLAYGVTVTAKSVEGTEVDYDIKVDNAPSS